MRVALKKAYDERPLTRWNTQPKETIDRGTLTYWNNRLWEKTCRNYPGRGGHRSKDVDALMLAVIYTHLGVDDESQNLGEILEARRIKTLTELGPGRMPFTRCLDAPSLRINFIEDCGGPKRWRGDEKLFGLDIGKNCHRIPRSDLIVSVGVITLIYNVNTFLDNWLRNLVDRLSSNPFSLFIAADWNDDRLVFNRDRVEKQLHVQLWLESGSMVDGFPCGLPFPIIALSRKQDTY